MMRLLPNTNLAIGVTWSLHESRAVARQALAGRRGIKIATKSVDGEYLQGVIDHPGWRNRLRSAALLLAETGETLIIYHRLDDGQIWLCGVNEGNPYPGFDQIVSPAEADTLFNDLVNAFSKPLIIGDAIGARLTLAAFFERPGLLGSKSAYLESPHAGAIKAGLLIIALASIGGLYFVGNAAVKVAEARVAADQAEILAAQQRKAEAERQKALQVAVDSARATIFQQPELRQQFAIWHEFLRQVPLSHNGWRPQSVNCVPAECQVSWKKDLMALPSTVSTLPGSLSAQTETDATTVFPLEPAAQRLDPPGGQSTQTYLVDLAATNLQVALRVQPPTQDIIPQLPPPFTGQSNVAIGREGTFEVVNSSPLVLNLFMEKLALPGVLLRSMKVPTFNGGKTLSPITVEGAYRVAL